MENTKQTPEAALELVANEVTELEHEVANIIVASPEGQKTATDFLGRVKSQTNHIEEVRKFFVQPLNDQVKAINNKFKVQTAPLNAAVVNVKGKISAYLLEEDKKARAEETRLAKLQAEKNARRAAAEKPIDDTPPPVVARPVASIGTDAATTNARKVWKFDVIDPSGVPRQFCSPDEKIIRQAIKEGERIIGGVRIYEDMQISTRTYNTGL